MSIEDRSYHSANTSYSLPNDSVEHVRLDWQSRALTNMMGGSDFLTNIPALAHSFTTPFRAIEVGPGTGLRTAVLAQGIPAEYSSAARIYGVDISPVPALYDQPSTVEFIQADIMELPKNDGRFKSNSFNFITHRMLVGGLNLKEYTRVCFDLLQSGGRVEFQDTCLRWYDAHDNEISKDYKWLRVFNKASSKLGLDSLGPEKLPEWLRESGFVDVEVRSYRWLTSEEDEEEIAKYTVQSLNSSAFPTMVRRMIQGAGVDQAGDLEGLGNLDSVMENYRNTVTAVPKGTHTKFFVTTGRKP